MVAGEAPLPTAKPVGVVDLPASLPLRRDGGTLADSTGVGALRGGFLVLLLLGGGSWCLWRWLLARRSQPESSIKEWRKWLFAAVPSSGVKVLESTRLTTRASLHVVQWDGKEWLVGCTEHGLNLLAERPIKEPDVTREQA